MTQYHCPCQLNNNEEHKVNCESSNKNVFNQLFNYSNNNDNNKLKQFNVQDLDDASFFTNVSPFKKNINSDGKSSKYVVDSSFPINVPTTSTFSEFVNKISYNPMSGKGEYLSTPPLSKNIICLEDDVKYMELRIQRWTEELRRRVIDECGQSKVRLLEQYHLQLLDVKERHISEMSQARYEIESLQTLLKEFQCMFEQKDEIIRKLNKDLVVADERLEVQKRFSIWRLRVQQKKRELFTNELAQKHLVTVQLKRAWKIWRKRVEEHWKEKLDKACQRKAQKICIQLTKDYESKIKLLTEQLSKKEDEVVKLLNDLSGYEKSMKKALMRGISALNLEAMNLFQEPITEIMSDLGRSDELMMDINLNKSSPLLNEETLLTRLLPENLSPMDNKMVKSEEISLIKRLKPIQNSLVIEGNTKRHNNYGLNRTPNIKSVVVERHKSGGGENNIYNNPKHYLYHRQFNLTSSKLSSAPTLREDYNHKLTPTSTIQSFTRSTTSTNINPLYFSHPAMQQQGGSWATINKVGLRKNRSMPRSVAMAAIRMKTVKHSMF